MPGFALSVTGPRAPHALPAALSLRTCKHASLSCTHNPLALCFFLTEIPPYPQKMTGPGAPRAACCRCSLAHPQESTTRPRSILFLTDTSPHIIKTQDAELHTPPAVVHALEKNYGLLALMIENIRVYQDRARQAYTEYCNDTPPEVCLPTSALKCLPHLLAALHAL